MSTVILPSINYNYNSSHSDLRKSTLSAQWEVKLFQRIAAIYAPTNINRWKWNC